MMRRQPVVLNEEYVRACADRFEDMDEVNFSKGHHALIGAVADEVPEATRDELEAGLLIARSTRCSYSELRLAA